MEYAAVSCNTPTVCAEQLFLLDIETHNLTYSNSYKNDIKL